jgi:uncharacterized protein YjdB
VTDANGRADITNFTLEVRPLVTAVFIDPKEITIEVGQTVHLTPSIRANGPTGGAPFVTWISSEPCRVKVNQDGFVTGLSGGGFTATITATSIADPTIKAFATVRVVGTQTVPIGSSC